MHPNLNHSWTLCDCDTSRAYPWSERERKHVQNGLRRGLLSGGNCPRCGTTKYLLKTDDELCLDEVDPELAGALEAA